MKLRLSIAIMAAACALPSTALAADGCHQLPDHDALKAALKAAVDTEGSGLNNQMWGTIVDRDGIVCAVAFSGEDRGSQWPGSRAISAQKANTANSYSLDGLALSTANLFSAVQPGASLYGLQASNPVDVEVAYKGPSKDYGQHNDPMVGSKIGGVNVFGGGLPLYNADHKIVGAIGVSGDTSCADHRIGWRTRDNLNLDNLSGIAGVSGDPTRPDNMVFDITPNPNGGIGISAGGFGHAHCLSAAIDGDPSTLPAVQ